MIRNHWEDLLFYLHTMQNDAVIMKNWHELAKIGSETWEREKLLNLGFAQGYMNKKKEDK